MPEVPAASLDRARADGRTSARTFVILVFLGLLLFIRQVDFSYHPLAYIIAPVAAALALLRGVRNRLVAALDRLRAPSPLVKWVTFVIVFVVAVRYFLLCADQSDRGLFPTLHDEFMYLLQARMLAHGHLWMPQHPLAPFFDSFNILVKPVYAAVYFPGTALLYVPGDWLGREAWITSVMISGLAVAMLYLVMTRLIDGVAGLLAVLLALSLRQFRILSVMTMSHPAMLLLLLCAVWSYLCWREKRTIPRAVAIGLFAGWAAITRPLDAVGLLLPIGLAVLWDLRRSKVMSGRRRWATLAAMLVAAAPFLALQLAFDKKVTGSFFSTPLAPYAKENMPGLSFGFGRRAVPATSPSALPQVRDYYRIFLKPELESFGQHNFLRTWSGERLVPAADAALPARILLLLLPLGLLGLRSPGRAAIAGGALLLPLGYTFYTPYLIHYGLVLAPAFILLVLLGLDVVRRCSPGAGAATVMGIAAFAIGCLPELTHQRDPYMVSGFLADVNEKLSHLEHTPAVVLFRYEPDLINPSLVHHEPVFNIDTAWPDDAEVIRAHDLGDRNRQIFDYYAHRQPNRFFYLYNRRMLELTPLGWATDLAATQPVGR